MNASLHPLPQQKLSLPQKLSDGALFFWHWLRHPLAIGAFLPSSRSVARAMAELLPPSQSGCILELGGGTGALTHGLLDAGFTNLIVVEREPALAAALRDRFPGVMVLQADARMIGGALDDLGIGHIGGVVSSLPIKWFDTVGQRGVIDGCFAHMPPGGVFLQLTNAMVSPLKMRSLALEGCQVARVWSQFPPVQIWRYRRTTPTADRQ